MRSIVPLLAVLTMLAGCQQESINSHEASATTTTVSFSVPDMMCQESCVKQVEKALAAQPGVKEVHVDFPAKLATVVVEQAEFDGDAALAALVDYQFTSSQLLRDEDQQVSAPAIVPALGVPAAGGTEQVANSSAE